MPAQIVEVLTGIQPWLFHIYFKVGDMGAPVGSYVLNLTQKQFLKNAACRWLWICQGRSKINISYNIKKEELNTYCLGNQADKHITLSEAPEVSKLEYMQITVAHEMWDNNSICLDVYGKFILHGSSFLLIFPVENEQYLVPCASLSEILYAEIRNHDFDFLSLPCQGQF